jgi:hypothetical protein
VKKVIGLSLALALGWILVAEAADEPQARPAEKSTAQPPATQKAASRTMDRLELDTTAITGNRELPTVMYVVPWKRADLGDLGNRPPKSLVDEILAPVDRDVFSREISYFDALKLGQKAGGEKSVTAGGGAP